jgi:hypothetical protein
MTTGMSAGQTSCLPVGGASRLAPYKGVAGARQACRLKVPLSLNWILPSASRR